MDVGVNPSEVVQVYTRKRASTTTGVWQDGSVGGVL